MSFLFCRQLPLCRVVRTESARLHCCWPTVVQATMGYKCKSKILWLSTSVLVSSDGVVLAKCIPTVLAVGVNNFVIALKLLKRHLSLSFFLLSLVIVSVRCLFCFSTVNKSWSCQDHWPLSAIPLLIQVVVQKLYWTCTRTTTTIRVDK